MAPAKWGRSSTFFFRKCIAKQTRCCQKRLASKVKRSPSPGWRLKSRPRLKNCGSRCRTSNEPGERTCPAGDYRFGSIGLGEIDTGTENFGVARNDAFGLVYHPVAQGDRSHREML